MSRFRRGLLSLACLMAFSPFAPAQPWAALAHTSFRHHTDSATGMRTSLAQDHTGFIWVGTQTGLIRWDGARQRRYLGASGKPGALPDSYIMSLHVDGRGRLWAGTSSGGLARYDADRDSFATVGVGPGGLAHGRISAIVDDGQGGLWIGSGGGLERVAADGTVHAATSGAPQIPAGSLARTGVDALLRDRDGGLWIGTRTGLHYRAGEKQAARPVALLPTADQQPAITAIHQDGQGRIWLGTRAHGAFTIDAPGATARAVLEQGRQPSRLAERVLSLLEKTPGVMWIGLESGGILEVETRTGATRRIRHQADVQDSLVDDDVNAMLRERSGQIFVTTIDALSQHDPRPQGVTTVRNVGGAGKMSVNTLTAMPGGQAWLAVAGGAIEIVDPRAAAGASARRIEAAARGGPLPPGHVLSIAPGPDGTIFIGTQHGLYRSDANGANVRRIAIPGRGMDVSVWALVWKAGVLWVGGQDGLWAVAMQGGPRVLRHEDASLGDSRVIALLPADDGSLWIGTSIGLARIASADAPLELIPADGADPTRLPHDYVTSLLFDRRGRLWVSHFSNGVSILEKTDRSGRRWFKRLGRKDNMPEQGVNMLVADRRGQIWLSTDDGLASIDPDTYRVRWLNALDGVQVASYWSTSGARGAAGEILFGGTTGLTVVHPERLERTLAAPTVAVTQLSLGGRDLPVAPLNRPLAGQEPLTVAPAERERGFSLEFAALDYAPSELARYAYRLEGFEHDWIDTEAGSRRVSYNNLPPGDYTLQLRAIPGAGGVPVSRSVAVRVLPAWHQQWWVRALAGLGVLALIGALVQVRIALLRRRQRELEAMVDARTSELRATQVELEMMAYNDALTGLPNRRRFNEEMRRLVAQAQDGGERFILLLIDLDHFKAVNDTLGHDAGDALLMAVAQRLKDALRDHDCIARLGGDEFAVLISPGLDPATLEGICRRIVTSLSQPIPFGGHTMQVSASVGAAFHRPGANALERTYKAADVALYESKHAGRNAFRIAAAEETGAAA